MRKTVSKIWIPALLVMAAALQSFGIDAGRAVGLRRLADSLALTRQSDSSFLTEDISDTSTAAIPDSLHADSLCVDSVAVDSVKVDTLILSARDTIKVPDSLRETDPFFFKYYIAVKDSTTRRQVRDSLLMAGDTIEVLKLDSLYIKDSTEVAKAKHDAWYASLSRMERKKYDAEQALPGLIAKANRKMAIKDSIKNRRDSIIQATPRILETFAFPDSLHYKRIVTWTHDRDFHEIVGLRDQSTDSSFNYNFHDYNFYRDDLNASWLGVIGSPVQLYDYFKREEDNNEIYYSPYQIYSYTPETLPQFNTKTPYTELCYWGTLFANREKEESNVKVLTTQNITPELNITMQYTRNGSKGMLRNEDVNNRNAFIGTNYTGKRYLMHAGFIYNSISRGENGGVVDEAWIRDTLVDAREIEVHLNEARSSLKKNTVFLDQTYRIPFTFLDKEVRAQKKADKKYAALKDSIMTYGDSIAIAQFTAADELKQRQMEQKEEGTDSIKTDITTAFIGHSSEYSVVRKSYNDNLSTSDEYGREFFDNRFYLNPTTSHDSLRVMRLENKVFMRLQPWKDDGIISKLDVGLGDKMLNYFSFDQDAYLTGGSNKVFNSVYLYAGAQGQYDKYLHWNAKGQYTFLGHEINDFGIEANVSFNAYPFRRDRKSPLTLNAHFETTLKEPDYYQQHMLTNHYRWDNDFGKISSTRLETSVSVPRWKLYGSFSYGLLSNNIYYDTMGVAQQNSSAMSVISANLHKDFQIWKFHLENRATLQFSSNEEVMPLPLLALNLRYYFQFDVVKNVMKMQIGANCLYTTKWYAPAYNPVVGVFHNQTEREYGNCPYIDAFVNIQWKRVSLFVKAINVNMGWPCKDTDYFTAAGYIAPQRAIKFGIKWPFWVLSGKNGSSSASRTGAAGSGRSPGSSSPSGMNAGGRQGALNRR
jgi:hypothetical protein